MKRFFVSLNDHREADDLMERLRGHYPQAEVYPRNITNEQSLVAVLSEVVQSEADGEQIYIIFDTDFCREASKDTPENTPLAYIQWAGVYSTLFKGIGEETEQKAMDMSDIISRFKTVGQNPAPVKEVASSVEVETPTEPEPPEVPRPQASTPENYRPLVRDALPTQEKTMIRILGNGGVGKTLISLNLTKHLLECGKSVLLVGDAFTYLYNKNRVNMVLLKDYTGEEEVEYVVFDGMDSDSENEPNEQRWLIAKNRVEFDHYIHHFSNLIYNDSDGYDRKLTVVKEQCMPFSEEIFKRFRQAEEILIKPSLFWHLVLFAQFSSADTPKKKKKFSIQFV